MKNYILLFLFFNISLINAKKYVFNTLTKYTSTISSKPEIICYTNSKDDTYYLELFKNNDKFTACLSDIKNNIRYNYSVLETYVNNEIIFNFIFENSNQNQNLIEAIHKKYVIDFQTISVTETVKKVKMQVFKNSKKKRPIMEYEIEIKKSNENYFPAFRISCVHPFEFLNTLNTFENGIVIAANGKSLTGNKQEFKLDVLKEVNLELEVKP